MKIRPFGMKIRPLGMKIRPSGMKIRRPLMKIELNLGLQRTRAALLTVPPGAGK